MRFFGRGSNANQQQQQRMHGSSQMMSSGSSTLRASTYQNSRMSAYQLNTEQNVWDSVTSNGSSNRKQCCSCTLSPRVKMALDSTIKSKTWKLLMAFFSLVLLFGAQVRDLIISEGVDEIYDIVTLVTLGYFIIDITLRVLVQPNYFHFNIYYSWRGIGYSDNIKESSGTCPVASFMFFCDVISTAMLFYDISFVNQYHFAVHDVEITLDGNGMPSGLETLSRLQPVSLELELLVTIGKCARVGRFVRSRALVDASNKINWYWLWNMLQYINPFFYWRKIQCRKRNQNTQPVGDESTSFVRIPPRPRVVRRNSWGLLRTGIFAAVRSQAEAEAVNRLHERRTRSALWGSVEKTLRSMGLMETEENIRLRNEAAKKIQRAVRVHQNKQKQRVSGSGGNSYRDRTGGGSGTYTVPLRSNNSSSLGRMTASRSERATESRFQSQSGKGRESQVGSEMRELTGQRVATGVMLALVFAVFFTYTEENTTKPATMIVLHEQTNNTAFRMDSLFAARNTSTPELFRYEPADESDDIIFPDPEVPFRDREITRVSVRDSIGGVSVGWFSVREVKLQAAWTEIAATIFIILVWFFGVTAFSGPVMSLVVIPIERMVKLLGMLMLDPLGYQSTHRFKKFLIEEDALVRNTMWTKEVLKGMETSFLMSTILRIGSLMKVGFGSAGVEIIRNNLQKGGQSKNLLILNSQGSTVPCIFLFCDIRQFTDATESLQEEVFVFTNRIAAVVHSICHSYGGAANKNVGDAFLLSWSLEDDEGGRSTGSSPLKAKSNQADKALLSVIKICISLRYDKFYLEPLSEVARKRLDTKMKHKSPVVRMGFGLHAGKAVQGAIGSQRKIDATYVSEAVERAEFLEGSTKQYGLNMLMSGSFHSLLHPNTRRRCRKIDQILIQDEEDDDYEDDYDDELRGELMELYTFDMDVDALNRVQQKMKKMDTDTVSDAGSNHGIMERRVKRQDRRLHGSSRQVRNRRRSVTQPMRGNGSEELFPSGPGSLVDSNTMGSHSVGGGQQSVSSVHSGDESNNPNSVSPELVLPAGPALYSHNVWQSPDMKRIRDKFVQGLFFQKYQSGLQAFYKKDWETAHQCFTILIDNFDDGPSHYFMGEMKKHGGEPPRDFRPYGLS